jgi:NAD(P)-dependent dehydrogenase (short-subunit alcohol dehydrogenase family)
MQRNVVITGASAGVGRATARAFAERGVRLGLLARGRTRLEETREEVESRGGEAIVLAGDVSSASFVESAAESFTERFGPPDVWINNAMATVFSPLGKMTPEEYKRVTEVTYLGTVYGSMAALKRMKPRNQGVILQVGSALAYRAIPLQSAYCGAKHAIQGFSESLRAELIHDKSEVHVVMVQMPALNTPQFLWSRSKMPRKAQPVPPIYQPEVAAEAILWAAEHGPRELNVGGSTSVVLALNKFFPGIGDYYLGKTSYDDQQTEQSEDPERPDNLFQPVEASYAARGPFDHKAKKSSKALWASTHKGLVAATGVLVAGLAYRALSSPTFESSEVSG